MPIGAAGPAHFQFIPTYVGHTVSFSTRLTSISVHPHIRGAYADVGAIFAVQVRFIPTYVGHTYAAGRVGSRPARFIPTYVGHTNQRSFSALPDPVHPHIRGAYNGSRSQRANSYGSSPHTWGIPVQVVRRFYGVRFIPTYVGHTPAAAKAVL